MDERTAQQNLDSARLQNQTNAGTGVAAPVASPDRMLQFFQFAHLPARLQDVSRSFGDLAEQIAANVPQNPERTVCLRKLLEAKDCAVRAVLYEP